MASPARTRRVAARKARKYGINQGLFLRQINQESGFRDVRSPAGAQGPAQIIPATARAWGVRNVHDPNESLDAAARHMAEYLRAYHGSWPKALTAYNAGPGAVGGSLPAETRNYIRTILGGSSGRQQVPGAPGMRVPGGPLFGFKPDRLRLEKQNVFDTKGFAQAQRGAILGQLIAKHRGTGGPLFKSGLLSTTEPSPGDFTSSKLISQIVRGGGARQVGHLPGFSVGGGSAPARGAKGAATFEGVRVAAWIKPELEYARRHGWRGKVTSGYRSVAEQRRIYNSGVRPAAKPGQSNHNFTAFPGGAVDVSDAATLSRILRRKGSALKWAGAKDPVHFSHPHGGSY